MTSLPQPVAVSMDRYWRLTVDASDSTLGRLIPRLEVDSINQSHENGIQRWVFPQGAAFELGGVQRLAPQSQPLPTRRIVLWSVLLAGVFIVAAMAWRLARRLKL